LVAEFIEKDLPSPRSETGKAELSWEADDYQKALQKYFVFVNAVDDAKVAILTSLPTDQIREYIVDDSSQPPTYVPTTPEGIVVRSIAD